MKRLVVVESPTKARTIRRILTDDTFQIEACNGHVRDLPANASEIPSRVKGKSWARLGVNTDKDFEPVYVVPSSKAKVVKGLKSALRQADELIIATDEDREGESIGWHLIQVLKPNIPVKRMVFHEITPEAIRQALTSTRDIDERLVNAQETRRVLDRLVGYVISPLLWRKIAPKLSAGRVQSVAVRLLVLKERERLAFVAGTYWGLKASLEHEATPFSAQLTHLGARRIATGKDFDEQTGKLSSKSNALLLDEETAVRLEEALKERPWQVTSVDEKTATRKPYPPFITSTLQQEANRKLGLAARETMRIAQALYERGLITYMRTDSTHLSDEAVGASRKAVEKRYGKEYLSKRPRRFGKNRDTAQEAHEAVRPAGTEMKAAADLHLSGREYQLYDLIWKRTVASQMADARLRFTIVSIAVEDESDEEAVFRTSGRSLEFPGFFRAYVEGSDDPESALEDRETLLPPLKEKDRPEVVGLEAQGKETRPPARYTEASLVKRLEEEGIGRPSTYATIIGTIMDRGYVKRQKSALVPTYTAFATTRLLEKQFEKLVDTGFTSRMEQVLDEIAEGKEEPLPYLKELYAGDDGLVERVEAGLESIDARQVSTLSFSKWGPYKIRIGKFGPYITGEVDGSERTAPAPALAAPADIDAKQLEEILREQNGEGVVLGKHPEQGTDVMIKVGPYGPYIQMDRPPSGSNGKKGQKPKRVSLPKGIAVPQVDLAYALALLELPREIGLHPETGEPVLAGIGRYGPYVQHQKTYASLQAGDDVLGVTLDRALELFASKNKRGKEPLRELGNHPDTGKPVVLLDGRYGPYVKHERTNASLPKDSDVNAVTLEQAVALLEERKKRGKGGRKRGRKKRS